MGQTEKEEMISYSQRDPQWAEKKLGTTNLTLGRFGCTITSIADLASYFGDNLTPPQVADICKFTPGGLLIWTTCKFGHFQFERREFNRHDVNIKAAIADPNRAVILQVANGSHWVVATSPSIMGIYNIADPWLGDRSTVRRYGNITGSAYFRRN